MAPALLRAARADPPPRALRRQDLRALGAVGLPRQVAHLGLRPRLAQRQQRLVVQHVAQAADVRVAELRQNMRRPRAP